MEKSAAPANWVGAGGKALGGECPPATAFRRRLRLYSAPKDIPTHVQVARGPQRQRQRQRQSEGAGEGEGEGALLSGNTAIRQTGGAGRPAGRRKRGSLLDRRVQGNNSPTCQALHPGQAGAQQPASYPARANVNAEEQKS